MKIFRSFLFIFVVAFLSESAIIYTNADPDSIMIGDRIHYSVSIVTSPTETLSVVNLPDTAFGKMTVLEKNIKTLERGNSDSTILNATLTTFDYDTTRIPSIPFLVKKSGRVDTLMAMDIPLTILSAIKADSGDTVRFKDIEGAFIAGKPSYLWTWILLALIVVGFIAYLIYIKFIKKELVNFIPPKPPYDEAIEALSNLERGNLLSEGQFREFVFELSEILKRYIDRRFDFPILESTTEEILEKLKDFTIDKDKKKFVKEFFENTHFIKFAKVMPERSAVLEMKDSAKSFIIDTKPAVEVEK